MTESVGAAQRTASRLAIVCAKTEQIRTDLLDGAVGSDGPLEEVLTAVREGKGRDDLTALLDALHAVLQADGDAQGLHGYDDTGMRARSVHALGVPRALPGDVVYLCPAHRCARHWWSQGPAPVPRCSLSGAPLRRARM